MKIKSLYFERCPNFQTAFELLKQVLKKENINLPVDKIKIESREMVVKKQFFGSSSIRINELDINRGARNSNDYGEECRINL